VKTKTQMKTMWLGAAVLGLAALTAGRAEAAASSNLNIDVTISANVSVAVNTVASSTQTVPWSGGNLLGSSATVTNDSTYFASQWKLSTTANSWDSGTGAAGWAIGSSAAADQLKLQAVFGPATTPANCTGALFASAVVAPALSNTTPLNYTATQLADVTGLGGGTAAGTVPDGASSFKMNAGSARGLCWKMTMPTSTSFTGTQVVPIIVTAF
jgi:hypothetical protein